MPYVAYVRLCGCASSITVPDLQNDSFESLNSSIEQDRSPSLEQLETVLEISQGYSMTL